MPKTKKLKKTLSKKKVVKKVAKIIKKVASKTGKTVKKVKTSTIHHVVILDRSGSMDSVKNSTIGGFNENAGKIRDLAKANPNQKHTVTLVTFSCKNDNVYWLEHASSIKDLTPENYVPSGSTALCDAMGRTIVRLKDELEKTATSDSPVSVLVTIITDGEENTSKEYDAVKISALIESLKGNPNFVWTITYMGANQDVMSVAKKYNIAVSNVAAYTSSVNGTRSAFQNLSSSRDAYSRGFAASAASGESLKSCAMNFFSADANAPADFTQDANKANTAKPLDLNQTMISPVNVKNSSKVNNKTK